MVKRRVQLLAIDIDGTLLNSRYEVSAPDVAALRRAHENGVEIILATGRRHSFARPIAERLGFFDHLWIISSNGAITRSFAGELFHRDMLPAATTRRLVAHMDAYRGHIVVTFDKEEKGALVLEHLRDLQGSIKRWLESNLDSIEFIQPIEDSLVTDPVQAMFCGSFEQMQQAQRHLETGEVATGIHVMRTIYPHRDLSIIDVLNQGCSKGHALRRWAEFRGIEPAEVMAIGDNYNDLEMLEFAGLPVIMGNASEELKQRGWHVTLTHDQSGVAAALEQMGALERSPAER
jgi:Cof subfamily protein (haloacid dehalogenase superfamily)